MPAAHGYLLALLQNLTQLREKAGITPEQLGQQLILGPGWIERFESGESIPSIDMVLAILHAMGADLHALLKDLPEPEAANVERMIFGEEVAEGIQIHFRYADHNAEYTLPKATLEEFE